MLYTDCARINIKKCILFLLLIYAINILFNSICSNFDMIFLIGQSIFQPEPDRSEEIQIVP